MSNQISVLKDMDVMSLYELLEEDDMAEILLSDIYGYLTEECSKLEESIPATVNLTKYDHVFIVWIDNECPDFSNEMLYKYKIFQTYEDAEECFLSWKNQGIKSISEQIQECVNHTMDSQNVSILLKQRPYIQTYDVYYKGSLLIEHMRELNSQFIDYAIEQYNRFCTEYAAVNLVIKKQHDRRSYQNAYALEYVDRVGKGHRIVTHIRSALQGQQRCSLDIINIEIQKNS